MAVNVHGGLWCTLYLHLNYTVYIMLNVGDRSQVVSISPVYQLELVV